MEAVKSSHRIDFALPKYEAYELIEIHGRKAYQSYDKKTEPSDFIKMIMNKGHLSVIEHSILSVSLVMDRGCSHELVRHRLASFTQESTRYCSYDGHIKFVLPWWAEMPEGIITVPSIGGTVEEEEWIDAMLYAERSYHRRIEKGFTPQKARYVLPNSLRTEIGVTANFREWLHIKEMRTSKGAHPDMKKVMGPLFKELGEMYPEIFGDGE